MVTSHHACLSNEMLSSRREDYSLLEPCEVLTDEEWILRGLMPWVNGVEENDVSLVHVDGPHDKAIVEVARFGEAFILQDYVNMDNG